METWMSWAVFLAIAGAAYLYYNQKNPGAARGRSVTRGSAASAVKDGSQWSDEDSRPKAPRKSIKTKAPRKAVAEAVQDVGSKVEASLASATTGAAHTAKELSAALPAAIKKAPSGKDVSDMLAPLPAAPAVLSIKASDKPSRPVKPQTQKAEPAQETKKQRQNRKKVEDAKIAREEEEKQRQALLEKQRRTAREARGEPAKNGLQAAKTSTSTPWTTVPSRGAVQPPVSVSSGPLLDTFDAPSTTSSSDAPTSGTASTAASIVNLSEEEQLRLVMEESAWTTVPKGGKKQRKAANEDGFDDTSNVGAIEAPAPVKPVRPVQALTESKKASSRYQILSETFPANNNADSDWPVV